jgi:hypothetical protein
MYGFTYRAACPGCGLPIEGDLAAHVCDADVEVSVSEFEAAFAAWLETPSGRFAAWDAARTRS